MSSIASSIASTPITTPAIPTSSATASASTSANSTNSLNIGTFMHLLTVELANQDPLNPTDDTSFYSQMAQMGELQGMQTLNSSSTVQQAQSLMGKTVTAVQPLTSSTNGQNNEVTGVVTQLINTNGNYTLGIQQSNGGIVQVPMTAIQTVTGSSTTSYANMIGQTVAGQAQITTNGVASTIAAVGQVIGISSDSGQPMLEVQTANNGVVAVAPASVSNIGTTSSGSSSSG